VFYRDAAGGVRVTWKVLDETADTATVTLTDFDAAPAASSNNVELKTIGDRYVVRIVMTSIS
jgi:hypothetical protein